MREVRGCCGMCSTRPRLRRPRGLGRARRPARDRRDEPQNGARARGGKEQTSAAVPGELPKLAVLDGIRRVPPPPTSGSSRSCPCQRTGGPPRRAARRAPSSPQSVRHARARSATRQEEVLFVEPHQRRREAGAEVLEIPVTHCPPDTCGRRSCRWGERPCLHPEADAPPSLPGVGVVQARNCEADLSGENAADRDLSAFEFCQLRWCGHGSAAIDRALSGSSTTAASGPEVDDGSRFAWHPGGPEGLLRPK